MNTNIFTKIIFSFPIILVLLYFLPFLGISLIIVRLFIYEYKKNLFIPIFLISIGLFILIFNKIYSLVDSISFFKEFKIISDNLNLTKFGIFILYLGVILSIIIICLKKLFEKITSLIKTYIEKTENLNEKVAKENDMEIKIKQNKARNTHVVHCPHCGASNILTEKTGTCVYCRRELE